MTLELLKEGDPQLLEVSEPWDFEVDGDPTELVTEMSKFMAANGGVGLAAPQVGIKKRIFIMGNFTKLVACINPMIVFLAEERVLDLEGCLSFPDLWLKVKRAPACIVQYYNTDGIHVERELAGMESRVFQHEFHHLSGITFDQIVPSVTLTMAKERRRKESVRTSRNLRNKIKS